MVATLRLDHDGRMSSIWTIRRSATDTKLSGLCGGVARYWGIDPVLVRLGCALLTLSGGIGLVLYVAGWLLIPLEGHEQAPVDDFFGSAGRRWPKEVWLTLVVIACLAVFALFGSVSPFGVGPALVLAVIWYFGFYRGRQPKDFAASPGPPAVSSPQRFPYPGPPTPFTEAAEAWRLRIEEAGRSTAEPERAAAYAWPAPPAANLGSTVFAPVGFEPLAAEPPAHDPEVAERQAFLAQPDPVGLYADPDASAVVLPVRRSRSRSARRLRLVGLIVLGLVLGVLAILDGQGVSVPLAGYLGAALLVVGLTLVAATWFGRARGLIPVGLLLTAAVLVTSLANPLPKLGHWDTATLTYTQAASLPPAGDSRDVGRLEVDLSRMTLVSDTTYRAHVETGSLEVIVPADVNVVLRYGVDVGVVRAYDEQANGGTDLHDVVSEPTVPDPTKPTLTLDLSVDHGDLQVRR